MKHHCLPGLHLRELGHCVSRVQVFQAQGRRLPYGRRSLAFYSPRRKLGSERNTVVRAVVGDASRRSDVEARSFSSFFATCLHKDHAERVDHPRLFNLLKMHYLVNRVLGSGLPLGLEDGEKLLEPDLPRSVLVDLLDLRTRGREGVRAKHTRKKTF